MLRVLFFVFLIYLALNIAALADCLGADKPPRKSTRGSWVAIILLVPIVGGLLWFTIGRPRPDGGSNGGGISRKSTGPIAPDDDPKFLRDLDRKLRDQEDHDDKLKSTALS